ncbi:hypothetical protein FH972_022928 [Carpinus fangiana]|uniref:Uncharacterized protein n=1 Tax=Carpinus fangiana TaxID=176857 RepID=A0A5N6KU70_9ROSI|nr:hypothetical protein FH972_022928 [Carpinus fangiana]
MAHILNLTQFTSLRSMVISHSVCLDITARRSRAEVGSGSMRLAPKFGARRHTREPQAQPRFHSRHHSLLHCTIVLPQCQLFPRCIPASSMVYFVCLAGQRAMAASAACSDCKMLGNGACAFPCMGSVELQVSAIQGSNIVPFPERFGFALVSGSPCSGQHGMPRNMLGNLCPPSRDCSCLLLILSHRGTQ